MKSSALNLGVQPATTRGITRASARSWNLTKIIPYREYEKREALTPSMRGELDDDTFHPWLDAKWMTKIVQAV
jgi:hypothetical protein